jgi:hypothetical protein
MSLAALAGAAGLYAADALRTAPTGPKPIVPGCHSKGVSVHTFYGRTADMERYLGQLGDHPVTSRVRVVVLESPSGASVHVFERQEGGAYTMAKWSGSDVGAMRAEWDEKILKSRGNSCAGADLKADLEARAMLPEPAEPAGGLGVNNLSPLVSNETGYMRLSLYDPCE